MEKIAALLSDDRFESKDWKHADAAGRIEWLIAMLEQKDKEIDMWVDMLNERHGARATVNKDERIAQLEFEIHKLNQTYKWKHRTSSWASTRIGEILAWCNTELEGAAWYLHGGWDIIYFTDLESYKLFLLRWE